MSTNDVLIRLEHVQKAFETVTPLQDVNAEIRKGDVISVIGPSGTGKSTLLRCINLLDPPTAGKIYHNGICITDRRFDASSLRQKIGMVFQSFNLFNHLTVVENVMKAPMDLKGTGKQEAYELAMELLTSVGLKEKALAYPDELSGGQKQRVAIARTLAMKPEMILLDEPTSALDPTMVGEVEQVIYKLVAEGYTMMIVTHDMKFARNIANRVFYMDDGGIYEDGTPDRVFDHPQKERTAAFMQQLKQFSYMILSRNFDFYRLNEQLMQYCRNNELDPRTIYKVVSVFEELAMQILLPKLPEPPQLQFTLICDKTAEQVRMRFRYGGEKYDPRETENDLAVKIVESMADEISFGYDDKGNEVQVVINTQEGNK